MVLDKHTHVAVLSGMKRPQLLIESPTAILILKCDEQNKSESLPLEHNITKMYETKHGKYNNRIREPMNASS